MFVGWGRRMFGSFSFAIVYWRGSCFRATGTALARKLLPCPGNLVPTQL